MKRDIRRQRKIGQLLQLAFEKEQRFRIRLKQANENLHMAAGRVSQLMNYQNQYHNRLVPVGSATVMRRVRGFVGSLHLAMQEAQNYVDEAREELERSRLDWRDAYERLSALKGLHSNLDMKIRLHNERLLAARQQDQVASKQFGRDNR